MAEAIGITQQTLSRIELTNKTNLSTAKKIAEYFGIDWWILYEDQKGEVFINNEDLLNDFDKKGGTKIVQ